MTDTNNPVPPNRDSPGRESQDTQAPAADNGEHESGSQPDVTERRNPAPNPTPESARSRAAKPRFGEMAPEGWSWQPPEADAAEGVDAGDPPSVAERARKVADAPSAQESEKQGGPTGNASTVSPARGETEFGPIDGVPHNLGKANAQHGQVAVTPQAGHHSSSASASPGQPPRALGVHEQPGQDPAQNTNTSQEQQYPVPSYQAGAAFQTGQPGQPTTRRPNRADRMATVVLLAFGAFCALVLAASMRELPSSLNMLASTLDLQNFTVPGWVRTFSIVSALAVLLLWAIALLWSIARLRARKLTFWVPLVLGAIAVVLVFGISGAVVYSTVPAEVLNDPNALQQLMESFPTAP
jgi:hypothetical protein